VRFAVKDPKKFDMGDIKEAIQKVDPTWRVDDEPVEKPEGKKPAKKG
jgi:hypothetical protein